MIHLLTQPRTFTPVYSNFTFNAAQLIGALLEHIRAFTNPETGDNYLDLNEYCSDNPVPIRVSADFADLYAEALGDNLLAKSVFPPSEITFGTYNLASGLTQTGTYKLASESPNPTTSSVDSTEYGRGTDGIDNTIDYAGTAAKGHITTTLNGTCVLKLSGYDHTGALQAWASGLTGWTITINSTLTAGTEYTAVAEDGSSRLLVLTAVSKTGAGTTGIVSIRTILDRTPTL